MAIAYVYLAGPVLTPTAKSLFVPVAMKRVASAPLPEFASKSIQQDVCCILRSASVRFALFVDVKSVGMGRIVRSVNDTQAATKAIAWSPTSAVATQAGQADSATTN